MSDDETDIEAIPRREHGDQIRQRKRFRRVNLAFRSDDISTVLHEIDHHYRELLPIGLAAPGNTPRERILEAHRTDKQRLVRGLPKDFYHETWLACQSEVQRGVLQMEPDWLPMVPEQQSK